MKAKMKQPYTPNSHPDKEFLLDHNVQWQLFADSVKHMRYAKYFLGILITFSLASYIFLTPSQFARIFAYLFFGSLGSCLIAVWLYPFKGYKCSKCQSKMKKVCLASPSAERLSDPYFLICEPCKRYADTGIASGS